MLWNILAFIFSFWSSALEYAGIFLTHVIEEYIIPG